MCFCVYGVCVCVYFCLFGHLNDQCHFFSSSPFLLNKCHCDVCLFFVRWAQCECVPILLYPCPSCFLYRKMCRVTRPYIDLCDGSKECFLVHILWKMWSTRASFFLDWLLLMLLCWLLNSDFSAFLFSFSLAWFCVWSHFVFSFTLSLFFSFYFFFFFFFSFPPPHHMRVDATWISFAVRHAASLYCTTDASIFDWLFTLFTFTLSIFGSSFFLLSFFLFCFFPYKMLMFALLFPLQTDQKEKEKKERGKEKKMK